MDQNYILLCAESAYNTVIIDNLLCEDYEIIQEGSISEFIKVAKEKIIKIGQGFVNAVKSLATKVLNAIKDAWTKIKNSKAVTELQNRAKAVKAKMAKKKAETKQESASLYDQLMEMVLTEEDNDSSEYVNFTKVFDHMRNCTDEILKQSYGYSSKFYQKAVKSIDDSAKFIIDFTKSSVKFVNDSDDSDVDKAIESIKNNQKETDEIIDSATEEALDMFIDKFNFKYSKPSSIDQLGSAISKEYQGCKKDYIINGESDELIDFANASFIDGYASALAGQFKQAKVMFDNAVKNMENINKDIESVVSAEHFSDNAKLNAAVINSLINNLKKGQSQGYRIATAMSKAATASAAVFTKLSAESLKQVNSIISKYENMYSIA